MKLVIQPAAREDILRQYRYYLLEKDSERTAQSFLAAVQETIQQVTRRPGIGSPKTLDHPSLSVLRSASVRRFPSIRAYYLASEDTIRVIRLLHGKRDIASILQKEPRPGADR